MLQRDHTSPVPMILAVVLLVGFLLIYTQVSARMLQRDREQADLQRRMERVELAIDAIANQVEQLRDRGEPGPRGLLPEGRDS